MSAKRPPREMFSEAIGKTLLPADIPGTEPLKRRAVYMTDTLYEKARAFAWVNRVPIYAVLTKALEVYLEGKEIPELKRGEEF